MSNAHTTPTPQPSAAKTEAPQEKRPQTEQQQRDEQQLSVETLEERIAPHARC